MIHFKNGEEVITAYEEIEKPLEPNLVADVDQVDAEISQAPFGIAVTSDAHSRGTNTERIWTNTSSQIWASSEGDAFDIDNVKIIALGYEDPRDENRES